MFILLCFVLVTWRTPQTFQLTGILGTVFVDSVDCMLNAQCHFLSPSSSKKKPGLKILPSCINVCSDCRGGSCGQTNMLQFEVTYRSAGGLTSSELGTDEIKAIEITGQVMKHWKDGLSVREALGSKMKSY